MLQEFKKFIMRGNVFDLAVAVIVGGAFNQIISSFVNDVVMPVLGVLVGGINLTD
jgi:large conductance mechanosensitive channel